MNQFDEKILQWGEISEITTLWRVNLRNFHTVHSVEAYVFPAIKILREIRFSESKTQMDDKV